MTTDAHEAARVAEASPLVQALARSGYAANGAVHVLVGVLALIVAFGGDGETDQAGAFKAIAAVPFGFVVLWVLAIALWALALWHAIEGLLARRDSSAKKWGVRVSEWGQALIFLFLGVIAASVALGAEPDADEAAQALSRGVLVIPGGVFVLGATGLGIAIGGIAFVVMGMRRSFENKMTIPDDALGRGIKTLGIVGFIAKGVALLILGILLLVAAVRGKASAAGGLDAAIDAVLAVPSGPWFVGAIGAGLIIYGIFCGFRAKYADL